MVVFGRFYQNLFSWKPVIVLSQIPKGVNDVNDVAVIFSINGYFSRKNIILYFLIISLGIEYHDGDNNNCSSSDQYIMATNAESVNSATRRNPFRFSNCSIEQLGKFVENLKGLVQVTRFYLLPKLNNLTTIK